MTSRLATYRLTVHTCLAWLRLRSDGAGDAPSAHPGGGARVVPVNPCCYFLLVRGIAVIYTYLLIKYGAFLRRHKFYKEAPDFFK